MLFQLEHDDRNAHRFILWLYHKRLIIVVSLSFIGTDYLSYERLYINIGCCQAEYGTVAVIFRFFGTEIGINAISLQIKAFVDFL
jgi:hypothetical protein